jgi:hypothetical protein
MYPGLSDADCQVANFHYRQLVNEGQRQQVTAGARPASGVTRTESSPLQQLGTFLVRAGRRLQVQGVPVATSESLILTPTGEVGAIA